MLRFESFLGLPVVDDKQDPLHPVDLLYRALPGLLILYRLDQKPLPLGCLRPQLVPICLGLAGLFLLSPPRDVLLDPPEHSLYRVWPSLHALLSSP